eukprot:COSAG04_NODE_532_length_12964_cov_6.010494_4_plen_92_part_00
MLSPEAWKSDELRCAQTAGVCAKAFFILSEKFARLLPCPFATIAAGAGVGSALRPSTQPEVRLLGPGPDGVEEQEELCVAVGSSGQVFSEQ